MNVREKIGWFLICLIFFVSTTGVFLIVVYDQRDWIKAESDLSSFRIIDEFNKSFDNSFTKIKASLNKIDEEQMEILKNLKHYSQKSPGICETNSTNCLVNNSVENPTRLTSAVNILLLTIEIRELFDKSLPFLERLQQLSRELSQHGNDEVLEFESLLSDMQKIRNFADLKSEFGAIFVRYRSKNQGETARVLANWVTFSSKDNVLYRIQEFIDAGQWAEIPHLADNIQDADLQSWIESLRLTLSKRWELEEIYTKFFNIAKDLSK